MYPAKQSSSIMADSAKRTSKLLSSLASSIGDARLSSSRLLSWVQRKRRRRIPRPAPDQRATGWRVIVIAADTRRSSSASLTVLANRETRWRRKAAEKREEEEEEEEEE